MDSLIFAVNAVLPIILTVIIGYVLKRAGLMPAPLAKSVNKLVFKIFLPCMLFLNVYNISTVKGIDARYILYTCGITLVIFFIALPVVCIFTKKNERRGALLQATFRSNYALIGIPLAQSLFGDSGAVVATLLSAVIIPAYNILAVITLSVFSPGEKANFKSILVGIVKNPLIQSTVAGILCLVIREFLISADITFRLADTPVYKVLSYLSSVATPLALICLGAQFEFSAIKALRREIIFGTVTRTVVVPLIALSVAYFCFGKLFNGAHFAAFVAAFATPVAVSSVPMAQEMKSDGALAGQLVVWSTIVSAFTVFIFTVILRAIHIF